MTGRQYQLKIRAFNNIGEGEFSDPYAIIAATVPDTPAGFVRDEVLSSRTVVALTWNVPPSNGGSDITGYIVEWDAGLGGGVFTDAVNEASTSHSRAATTTGGSYVFRVRAANAVGESLNSE
mgnify:CR=1 FL=1